MSGELVKVEESTSIIAANPFRFPDGQFWTSIDVTDPEQAAHLFSLRQASGKQAKECVNLPVEVTQVLRRWGESVNDDTGETNKYIGTAFLTKEGDVITSGSIGIERDVETLFALGVIPPWKPPLKISFANVPTTKGRSMLKMQIDIEDLKKRLKALKEKRK
jgi:hypothetical protein